MSKSEPIDVRRPCKPMKVHRFDFCYFDLHYRNAVVKDCPKHPINVGKAHKVHPAERHRRWITYLHINNAILDYFGTQCAKGSDTFVLGLVENPVVS